MLTTRRKARFPESDLPLLSLCARVISEQSPCWPCLETVDRRESVRPSPLALPSRQKLPSDPNSKKIYIYILKLQHKYDLCRLAMTKKC